MKGELTMRLVKCLALVATISISVVLCSCTTRKYAPLSAGIMNESYSMGNYKAEFNTSLFFLDKAVRRACARAHLTKTEHAYRTNSCEYRFFDIDKVPLEIVITTLEDTTGIKIRVGRWGDNEASQKLLVAIDEELRLLTQAPPIEK